MLWNTTSKCSRRIASCGRCWPLQNSKLGTHENRLFDRKPVREIGYAGGSRKSPQPLITALDRIRAVLPGSLQSPLNLAQNDEWRAPLAGCDTETCGEKNWFSGKLETRPKDIGPDALGKDDGIVQVAARKDDEEGIGAGPTEQIVGAQEPHGSAGHRAQELVAE